MPENCIGNTPDAKQLVDGDHLQVLRICLVLTFVVCGGMVALFWPQNAWLGFGMAVASLSALAVFVTLQYQRIAFLPASMCLIAIVYGVIHLMAFFGKPDGIGAAYYFCTILGAFFFLGITGGIIYSMACAAAVVLLYLPTALLSVQALNEFYVLITSITCTAIIAYYYEHAVAKRTYALTKSLSKMDRLADVDYLTGVSNRRHFFEQAKALFEQPGSLSLIALDIDDFKKINDTHGHACGDEVLVTIARLLDHRLRDDALLGRTGGEEFCILLRVNRTIAHRRAEELRSAIASLSCRVGEQHIPVTVSQGLATRGPGDEALEHLMLRADRALYEAKHHGKNGVALAKPGTALA